MSGYFSEILAIVQIYVSIWFILNFHDYFIYFRIIKKNWDWIGELTWTIGLHHTEGSEKLIENDYLSAMFGHRTEKIQREY